MSEEPPAAVPSGAPCDDGDDGGSLVRVKNRGPEWWEARNDMGRCHAVKKNGERCLRFAIKGAAVCRHHGGAAPQVRRKAQERILLAAEDAVSQILVMMKDTTIPAAVRLAAARDLLDRANIIGKQQIEVDIKAPWEGLVEGVLKASPEPDEWDVVEGEVLDDYTATTEIASEQATWEREPDAIVIDLNPPIPAHLRGRGGDR